MIENSNKFLCIGMDQKEIVKKIDRSKFLGLNNNGNNTLSTSRSDLFLFAMALGLETVKSEIKQKDTLVRAQYITPRHEALLYAAFINELDYKNNLDCILDIDAIIDNAQKYANTGFNLIADMMEKSENVIVYELLNELDEKYEMIINE